MPSSRKLRELGVGQAADAAEDLGVVLAEERGLAVGRSRGADEVDRGVDGAEDAAHVVPAVDEHASRFQVGAGIEVGLVLHHAHGVADADELCGHLRLGTDLRPFLDGGDEVVHVELAADALAEVAGVFDQVLPADETPEVLPFLRPAGACQDNITVLSLQGELGAEHVAPLAPRHLAGGLVEGHGAGHVGHHAVVHGHVDVLAQAGAVTAFEGHHDRQRRPDAGNGVADVVADHLWPTFGSASDGHPAAHALDAGVVGGPMGVGAGCRPVRVAVAGEAGVDEARVDLIQAVVAQSEAPQGAGTPVVQQDVGLGDHALEGLLAAGVAQVDGHALLVAVQSQVAGADPLAFGAVDEGAVGAAPLSHAGTLDLDDLGAHVGQDHGAEGAGHDVGDIQHPESVEGKWYSLRLRNHC